MDIKDLNKSQLILLAILLSFVVSIATGITTVTLMDQAPSSVTVPINRVVRETVEKIVPVPGKSTVQTVVVKEEDLVVDAIEKNQKSVFSIKSNEDKTTSLGKGFAVSDKGIIVSDAVFTGDKGKYIVVNESGTFKADFVYANEGISFLKIGEALNDTDKLVYIVPAVGDVSKMKLGQKVIVFGEKNITTSIFEGNENLNIGVSRANAGGMVMNLDGEALGIALFNEVTPFVPMSAIAEALKTAEASLQ